MEQARWNWERWLASAGLAYVVVHFIFLTLGVGPDATARVVQSEFSRMPRLEMQRGTLFEISGLVLLLFAVSLRAYLRPVEAEPKTLSSVIIGAAFAGTVLASIGSAIIFVLEANVARLGDANLTYSLLQVWWATYLGYCLMLGIIALAASAAALMTRMFPRWIGWLGIAGGVALSGGCLAFYPSGAVVQGPADSVAYIGEILFVVWSIAASVTILRGRRSGRVVTAREFTTEPAIAR